jgi:HrpA-like RNA helicase
VELFNVNEPNADRFVWLRSKAYYPLFPDLNVILMSATQNIEAVSAYFNHCHILHVPGFTHPVPYFLNK